MLFMLLHMGAVAHLHVQDKTVMMYCTGGIRCERGSAYLRSIGLDKVRAVLRLMFMQVIC